MDDLDSVLQFAQIAMQFGQAGMLSINQDEMVSYIAEKMGVPQSLLNSQEEKQLMIQQMQEMQAAQAPPQEGV
jgi:phage portal protein BeeE